MSDTAVDKVILRRRVSAMFNRHIVHVPSRTMFAFLLSEHNLLNLDRRRASRNYRWLLSTYFADFLAFEFQICLATLAEGVFFIAGQSIFQNQFLALFMLSMNDQIERSFIADHILLQRIGVDGHLVGNF